MSELNSDPPLSLLSTPSIHSPSPFFASSFLPILHPSVPSLFALHLSPFFLPFIHSIDPSTCYIGEPQKCLVAHYGQYVTDFPSH